MKRQLVALAMVLWAASASAQPQPVELSQVTATSGNPYGHVTGLAQNDTGQTIKLLFISYNLFDENGTQIGNAVAQTQDLAPGGRWQFDATTPVPFATYKLGSINVH